MLHANARSLKKNLEPLTILLSELNQPPHFIATSETKINKDTGMNFTPNIPGYSFAHSDTLMQLVVLLFIPKTISHMWYAMTFQKY